MNASKNKLIQCKDELRETILSQNSYFFIPFFIWIIMGGISLLLFSRDELFFVINHSHTPLLDKLNTILSAYGRGDIIPILLTTLLFIPAFRTRHYIFTTISFGIVIPIAIHFFKSFFNTPRPLKYYANTNIHTVPWLENAFETSFPSGHTMGAFGLFFLLSVYLPNSNKPWSLLFFFLALGCGFSRLYLGQHFFVDIYVGSIMGTLLTLIIYVTSITFIKSQKHHA
ncbi:MAG: phosphatase PAP2 family protein [Bacteroidetes bacterium]|nr:phosphatase PAP2 family protein [Bacteroidota bacterium]